MDLGSVATGIGITAIGPAGMGRALCVDPEAASCKLQASSLTAGPGYDRMNLERINYEKEIKTRISTRWR